MPRIGIAALGATVFVATVLGVLPCLSAPAKAELVVTISKSQQRLAVVVDGAETYRWPVSTGRRGFETPAGSFHPIRLERHWYSRQYDNSPMPWSMFFHRGYAMHGTVEVYNLGNAASHGCVRLRPDNAQILYSLVRKRGFNNTRIVVMNGPLPALPGATPMADGGTPPAHAAPDESFAKAFRDDEPRLAHADTSQSHGSEAAVLREREAWLRSLDRKYGITR
jgi:hypothetical protein